MLVTDVTISLASGAHFIYQKMEKAKHSNLWSRDHTHSYLQHVH